MFNESKYVLYRNKRIPGWWEDYLPKEANPYQATDTLTLEKGCLSNYWHIHSSNKHPNYRGAEACNFVHEMIYHRFGGAFLSGCGVGGGRKGEHSYYEPEHIVYKNAYIGEDGKIHIKNAKQYYEDVVSFVQNVLREIAKNHYQSGWDYEARDFFPFATDGQIEENRKKAKEAAVKAEAYRIQLQEYVTSEKFFLDKFEYESVKFTADYDWDDGWFNVYFVFSGIKCNVDSEIGDIIIVVDVPKMFHGDSKQKNTALAIKELEIPYCLYLRGKEMSYINVTIPLDKVKENVKTTIQEACTEAMEEYNKEHIDMIEYVNCNNVHRYYPYNMFLDNQIGKLKLKYRENAGRETWRMR